MGRIKDLREKVKAGEATEDEKVELTELEEEAKVEEEEVTDDEKAISAFVDKALEIIEAKKVKEDKIVAEKVEIKESGFEAEYKAMDKEKQMQEFYIALIKNDEPKLKVMSTTSADGGYLIPTVLYGEIVEEMRDDTVIRNYARVIPNCPAHLDIDQLIGRPKASWTAEKAIKDTTTATFDQIDLTPYTVAAIAVMTNKLIQDAEAGGFIVSFMTEKIAQAINETEDKAFAVGTGTTQPTGVNNYAATIHRINTTPANVLTSDSVITTYMSLGSKYRGRAYWLMNSITLTRARQLKDGQNRYLFNDDLTGGFVGTILGRPVLEQNDLPVGSIWLIDLKGYWIGDRGGITVSKSEDASISMGTDSINLWERNMTGIRVEKRVDGELVDLDCAAVLTGAN